MALTTCPECSGQLSTEAPTCPHCGFINMKRLAVSPPAAVAPLVPPVDPAETQVAEPIHDIIPMAPMSAPLAPPRPVAAPAMMRSPVQAAAPEPIPVDAARVRAVRDAQRRWAWRQMTATEGLALGVSIVAVVLVAIWVLGIFARR